MFPPVFSRASRLWDIVAACCVASFVCLFSFASFFPAIYVVFRFWALFKHLQICLFWLFLVVSCTFVAWPVCACMWFACRALCASKSSLHALWCSCDNHTILVAMSPPHIIVPNMSCSTIIHSFCLVLRLLRDDTSPCKHANLSLPSWVPPYPFMPVHTFVVFLGNFPAIDGRESYPVHTFVSLLSCFLMCYC